MGSGSVLSNIEMVYCVVSDPNKHGVLASAPIPHMPAWGADPLTALEVDLIAQWIAEGASPSDNEDMFGCTNPEACNYDDSIVPGGFDDGSCEYPGDECEGFDQQLQELVYGYLEENCECALPLSIDVFFKNKEIIKTVNVLGQKSHINSKEQI